MLGFLNVTSSRPSSGLRVPVLLMRSLRMLPAEKVGPPAVLLVVAFFFLVLLRPLLALRVEPLFFPPTSP